MTEELNMVLMETEELMEKSIESFRRELASIRTGRANPALLDGISIDYYGVPTPLNQVSSISVVEGTQLLIKPFDKSTIKLIEQALNASQLGITPQSDATSVRLSLPSLTGERRKELSKEVDKLGESSKVHIRNNRRTGNDSVKKLELPEDLEKQALQDIQKLTDKFITLIDEMAKDKGKEIQTI